MKPFHFHIFLALCPVAVLAAGCGAPRYVAGQETRQDSTRVEVRVERVERVDTAYIEVPRIVERVVTRDTVSVLENDYALSRAEVGGDGRLSHSLETKQARVPVPVKATEERRDSIIFRAETVYVEKPVEVVRPLSRFVKAQIIGFWMLLAAAVICIILKIKKL